MELVSTTPQNCFKFVHSKSYQETQLQFLQCIHTHNPETIAQLLAMHPYHIDCLLQLSDVAAHGGDHAMAADLNGNQN